MNDNAIAKPPGIRDLRLQAGFSQERLARLADCSTSTVRLAERGWLPSPAIRLRLEAALGCVPATDEQRPGEDQGAAKVVHGDRDERYQP